MRNILTICREQRQSMAWWNALPRGEKRLLLADYRLRVADINRGG